MATWPATLPTDFLRDALDEEAPDNTIKQSMDVGPPKVRKRSTSAGRVFNGNQYMTTAQVAILDTFFSTTLSDGTDEFDGLTHPRTGASGDWMFLKPPRYSRHGLGYTVSLSLELQP